MMRLFQIEHPTLAIRFLVSVDWRVAYDDVVVSDGQLDVVLTNLQLGRDFFITHPYTLYPPFAIERSYPDQANQIEQAGASTVLYVSDFYAPRVPVAAAGVVAIDGRGQGLGTAIMHLVATTVPAEFGEQLLVVGDLAGGDAQSPVNRARRRRFWERALAPVGGAAVVIENDEGQGVVCGLLRDPYAAGTSAPRWRVRERADIAPLQRSAP